MVCQASLSTYSAIHNVSLSGEIEIYIDGQSVLHATGLVLRTEEGPDGRVQGLHIQTFFGGMSIFRLYGKLS